MKRKLLTTTLLMALGLAMAVPGLTDPQDVCEFEGVVVFATNSVQIATGSTVTGNVVANAESPGPVLDENAEVAVDRAATVDGDISGDSINLDRASIINGDLYYTAGGLVDDGAIINGAQDPNLVLPVFEDLPEFQAADVVAGSANVFAAAGPPVVLGSEPDRVTSYGDIFIEEGGTVLFTGGDTFDVRSITASGGGQCDPCYSVLFDAPTALRVEGKLLTDKNVFIGPAAGSGIAASDIVVYVGGSNGTTGDLFDVPPAVNIGQSSEVYANFYVPNGTLEIDKNSYAKGAFLGRDVHIRRGTEVYLDTAFVNLPPVADPQTVTTNGDGAIVITLTGSDPEAGDLTFAIVTDPGEGTVSDPVEIIPDPIPVLDREGNPTGEFIQPPVTSATVVYTPTGCTIVEGEVVCPADSFLFRVADPCGAVGVASVDINPDDPGEECPVVSVTAADVEADTTPNNPVTIVLDGDGPNCGADLVYSITSLTAGGALSDSAGNPIGSTPYTLPDALVVFTAGENTGSFSFGYAVSDTTGAATATVSVTVGPPKELAGDSEVTTFLNSPVIVTLKANPGGTGTLGGVPAAPSAVPGSRAAGTTGAAIAGNVSDADGDGFGDGRDNLPGPAPVLIAAGVDVNLGSTPSGSVTDPAGDATDLPSDDPDNPDLVSASVSSDGTNLDFSVRFVQAGFNPQTSRATFVLDIDEDTGTGFPGIDAANNDEDLIGNDFQVEIGGYADGRVDVVKFVAPPNIFNTVGTFTATVLADGYDVSIPLATLDGDDGNMAFKVITQSRITENGFTGILDYMPDIGDQPGQSAVQGIQGVARIQIEWDISNVTLDEGETARVILTTEKGTVDSLDTMFYAGTEDGDGLLKVSDFETPADELQGVVMPVPPGAVTGDEGTFTFDVTNELAAAKAAERNYFIIQGRVDEDLAGTGFARGLQIHSTAAGNLPLGKEPKLEIEGEVAPFAVIVTLTSLPSSGTLTTAADPPAPVGVGSTFASTTDLVYTPSFGFFGTDTVGFTVTEGPLTDAGSILLNVLANDPCVIVGREPGCFPGSGFAPPPTSQAEAEEETAHDGNTGGDWAIDNLRIVVEGDGEGSVASSRVETDLGSLPGAVCDQGPCGKSYAAGAEVTLYARPIGDDSEFVRWGGDCAGTEPITTIRVWGKHLCTAEFGKKDN